jgi:adenine-specific DNA methylase
MVAVVLHRPGTEGKRYRVATERDIEIFREAERYLEEKRAKLMEEWGIDPVPDEPLVRVPVTFGVINVWVYGMNKWGDLFNSRQKLALITFTEKVKLVHAKIIEERSIWRPDQERNEHVFNRQALPIVWDYGERNPFKGSLVTPKGIDSIISHLSQVPPVEIGKGITFIPEIKQASPTELP